MNLSSFNHLSNIAVTSLMESLVNIPEWGTKVIENRPFISLQALYDFAQEQLLLCSNEQIIGALNNHPKIGEKRAENHLSAKEKSFSKEEQAKLILNQQNKELLADLNQQYQQKFGFIFLIRAKGRSITDIIEQLRYRLTLNRNQELENIKHQLSEIMILRLQGEIN